MSYKLGLGVLALISLADVSGPLLTDGEHPPYWIAFVGAALGVLSLALVALAWGGRRWAVAPLVVVRVLSAASAVPAFFAPDVPAAAVSAAAVLVVLTVVGTALVATTGRTARVAS